MARRVPVEEAGVLLDSLSATRRLSQQLVKADRLLRSPEQAVEIDADGSAEEDHSPAPPGEEARSDRTS